MSQTGEQIRATMRLDADILETMKARPAGIMTYVVANILRMERGYPTIATSRVLRRLKVMERWGQVERVRSGYAVQLCWRRAAA